MKRDFFFSERNFQDEVKSKLLSQSVCVSFFPLRKILTFRCIRTFPTPSPHLWIFFPYTLKCNSFEKPTFVLRLYTILSLGTSLVTTIFKSMLKPLCNELQVCFMIVFFPTFFSATQSENLAGSEKGSLKDPLGCCKSGAQTPVHTPLPLVPPMRSYVSSFFTGSYINYVSLLTSFPECSKI